MWGQWERGQVRDSRDPTYTQAGLATRTQLFLLKDTPMQLKTMTDKDFSRNQTTWNKFVNISF